MTRRILLVRHTAVALRWRGRCYGRTDVGLGRAGIAAAAALVAPLAALAPTAIVHSGLRRTRRLAEAVARAAGIVAVPDPDWVERDFGLWEGRSWHAIWRETGSAMDGMMIDPAGYRPGGGETGVELADRALRACRALPPSGTILVVTHGGPIASIRAAAAGRPLTEAVAFVPAIGSVTELPSVAG